MPSGSPGIVARVIERARFGRTGQESSRGARPSDREMDALLERRGMTPLFA